MSLPFLCDQIIKQIHRRRLYAELPDHPDDLPAMERPVVDHVLHLFDQRQRKRFAFDVLVAQILMQLLFAQPFSGVEREVIGIFGVIEKSADVVEIHSFSLFANATAMAPATLALFFNRAMFASNVRPSVFAAMVESRNGVTGLPPIPCSVAASRASSITSLSSFAGTSSSTGSGTTTSKPPVNPIRQCVKATFATCHGSSQRK